MKSPTGNQRGLIPLFIILAIIIILGAASCLWAWSFFGWNPFRSDPDNLSASAVAVVERNQTERTRIDAADKRDARQSFQQTLIILIVALAGMITMFFSLGLFMVFFSHRESVIGMQIRGELDYHQPESINYQTDNTRYVGHYENV